MARFSVKKLTTALLGATFVGAAAPALALPALTTPDGIVDPFGGFDYNSAASAVVTGFAPVTGTAITTTYFSNTVNINLLGGGIFNSPTLSPPGAGYEITVEAIINETITCLNVGCTSANFDTTSGSWRIWLDTTPDSSVVTGAGITDGTLILAGNINAGPAGTFTQSGTGGTGVLSFTGNVTLTNAAFINPALGTSNAVATLQFGTSTTAFTPATNIPAAGGASGASTAGSLILQADGNQAFQVRAIPEPGILSLFGVGLLLAGLSRRRR